MVLIAACRTPPAEPVAPARSPPLEVAFERILPRSAQDQPPLFGPDGSITVGATRWHDDGRRAERNAWDRSGQLEPIAVIGTAAHPEVVALAWSGFEIPDRTSDDGAWLVIGAPSATTPRTATGTELQFNDREAAIELSPACTAMVANELEALVVRSVPEGKELARSAGNHHACWIDDHHVAWLGNGVLTELEVAHHTRRESVLAGTIVACDPAGGRAAIATPTGIAVIDLVTHAQLGAITIAHYDHVALAGPELAVIQGQTLAVYREERWWLRTELVRTNAARPLTQLAFSNDGRELAVVGETLIVIRAGIRAGAAAHAQPDLPVGDLPAGFSAMTESAEWSYAQLATPSGWSALPAQIVHAHRDYDEAMTLAIDPATVSATLVHDADDAAIRAYALTIMPELFDSWQNAQVETDTDAEFTLRVGRRDGKPWFETRELWRDGCEPYDGYTQVVIDRDLLFVTRVLVIPGASTNPWLQTFFDVPFGHRTKLARRRGPDPGPC
ncbi:MAG: hypothetical protein ABI591_09985 [Kofleriaceae bacterium]